LQANRSPALAPLSTLRDVDTARIALDVEACQKHLARLRATPGIGDKARKVFVGAEGVRAPAGDPELALYEGFLPDADRALLRKVRGTPPEQLGRVDFPFADPRYPELLFRYRARNWPETLDAREQARWRAWRRQRLLGDGDPDTFNLPRYDARIAELRATATPPQNAMLDRYLDWGQQLTAEFTP
jgi:exodeoxyribonuclease-1